MSVTKNTAAIILAVGVSCRLAASPVLFFDDFSTDQGWSYGTEWSRGSATASSGHSWGNPDPALDYSASADNYVAGAMIGGNVSTSLHSFYFLTSPVINAAATAALELRFRRWLNSDYLGYMESVVEVYDGGSWVQIFTTGAVGATDAAWVEEIYDVSAYANASFQVRFGHMVGAAGVFLVSGWNIDDVQVADPSLWTATVTPTATRTATVSATATPTPSGTSTRTPTPTTCIISAPFGDGFESGGLLCHWTTNSTNNGRIRVSNLNGPDAGSFHLLMDAFPSGASLNEVILHIDLAALVNLRLRFDVKEFGDEDLALPASFIGSVNGDGIAISEDGVNWYTLTSLGATNTYSYYDLDLSAAMAAAGFSTFTHIRIKFQQYDDNPITTDGFAYDNIQVVSAIVSPTFTPTVTSTRTVSTTITPTSSITPTRTVSSTYTPSPTVAIDAYEVDDTFPNANWITVGDLVGQYHNAHDACDYDWVKFTATAGWEYTITTFNLEFNADTKLYLYDTDGITQLDYDDDGGVGLASQIVWVAPASGTYYARQEMYGCAGRYGANTGYDLRVTTVGLVPTDTPTQTPTITPTPTQTSTTTVMPTPCITMVPFFDGFESGGLLCHWTLNSTGEGRIEVSGANLPESGSFHVLLDDAVSGGLYSLNELVLHIDVIGAAGGLRLEFDVKEFGDETDVLPGSFVGSSNGDGVAISEDGVTWYTVISLAPSSSYTHHDYDLDALMAAAGFSTYSHVRIKFQQYDDFSISTDGFAFDNIRVAPSGFTPVPTLTPTLTPDASVVPTPSYTYTPTPPYPGTVTSYVYPQPAREILHFVYALSEDAWVEIRIYNFSGQLVAKTLARGHRGNGNRITFDVVPFAPGTYYYLLETKGPGVAKLMGPGKFMVVK